MTPKNKTWKTERQMWINILNLKNRTLNWLNKIKRKKVITCKATYIYIKNII